MQTMTKYFIGVSVSTALLSGSYGCRQIIGWEEATYWGDGGPGGSDSASSSSGGGMAGAGGTAGMGGIGGMGGMAGDGGAGGAVMSGCKMDSDCPTLPNSMPFCNNGKCEFTCKAGFGNCTVGAGCETIVTDNKTHCGACNKTCVAYCEGMSCNDPVSIAGGYHHHCAILKNGDVYCWGRNEKGELGDGTTDSRSKPTKVIGLPGPAVQVDGGASASPMNYTPKTCAVLMSGDLWCWGEGNSMPAKVNGISNVKEVSVGDTHTCAVTKADTLYCWGNNFYGQLGDGGNGYASNPVQIPIDAIRVSAGARHTCAVTNAGQLMCWGDNGDGQLGINSFTSKTSPTMVNNLSNVTDIGCASSHTCAVAANKAYCWGANQVGQLGTGNINQFSAPNLLNNLQSVTAVDVGYNFSGAISSDSAWMWGTNSNGQLANGTTNVSYSPATTLLTSVVSLRLASTSACAKIANGTVFCWGSNAYGQLGNNGNQQMLQPTPVLWP